MISVLRCLMGAAAVFGLAVGHLRAQTVTATLVGTVLDASGAAVPGAVVQAENKLTGWSRGVSTSENGDYRIPALPPGVYRLVVESPGFKRAVRDEIELRVEDTVRVDVVLQVGEVVESVEVTAPVPVVASETSSVGRVVENRQIVELPLKGRSFFELALLAPGTTPTQPGSFVANRRPMPGGLNAPAFQVGGAREKSNGYLVDGVDAQDPHFLTPSFFPSVDAIQEFKLLTNAYSAEYGRFAAQVSTVTRSGSNDFRGGVYHFLRNDKLDAPNFFDNFAGRPKSPYRYNLFGVNASGPVILPHFYNGRNRSFFFASYEGTRVRRGRTAQLNVPTPEQRTGDFSRLGYRANRPIFDPATTRRTATGAVVRDPFPGNRLPQARLKRFGVEVLSLYPLPTLDVPTGDNFFAGLSDTSDNNGGLLRLDHRLSDRQSMFFRYSIFDGIATNRSPIDHGGSFTDVRTQNMAVNYTVLVRPNVLYELRGGYNRPVYLILQDGAYQVDYASQLNLRNLLRDPIAWGVPQVSLTGFSGIGSDTNPTTQVSNVYHLVNHLTLTSGTHSLKLGSDQRKTNYNDRSERFARGGFSFTGGMSADPTRPAATGVSVADLLLGLPLTAAGSSASLAGNFNGFTHAFFVHDDWKLSRYLTLNLGLRYELNTRYTDVQNRLTLFDPDFPGGRLLISGTSQAYIPGQEVVDTGVRTPRGLVPTDTNNWGPRVGLAFRPLGSARMVVRAGYGIFYEIIELQDLRTFVRNPPFGEVIQLTSDQLGAADDPAVLRVEELFPARGTPRARPNVFTPSKKYSDPYYQQWNFGVQYEFLTGWMCELGYMGSKGTFLAQRLNLNQAWLDPDPARPTSRLSRTPFPLWGTEIRATYPEANSTFHAGFVQIERRLSGGLSLLASHTWSKTLDAGSLIDDQPRDIYNKRLSKGRASFDLRHRMVASAIWELPFGRNKPWLSKGLGGRLLGGWLLGLIFTRQTGFPFTVLGQGDVANTGAAMQTAQQVGDPWEGNVRRRERWFNTAAFVQPPAGRYGSAGRNILDGPSRTWLDLSLRRAIRLGEHVQLQVRAEAFNLTNTARFGQPGGTVGTATFGVIGTAQDARILQLALKLDF